MPKNLLAGYYTWRWLILMALGFLIYGQTLRYGFVFDDVSFIATNPFIKHFSHVHLILRTYPLTRSIGFYSFALNYNLNGLNPWGYHLFNLLIHLLATGLVWGLAATLLKITKTPQGPWTKEIPFIIALLFLTHPCQTQAVSYISQRFESMATVFYVGSIYAYLSARLCADRSQKILLFALAGSLVLLGLLTKEVIITAPLMMLTAEWIFFPRKLDSKVYLIGAVAALALFLLFCHLVRTDLRVFVQPIRSQSHDGELLTPIYYLMTQMRVFLTFLRLLFLPVRQCLDYDYPASHGLLEPPLTLVGTLVIPAIIFLIIQWRRRLPLIAFGLAWMLITFSINLAPRSNVIFEHKLYLISFGFFLAFVMALSHLFPNRKVLAVALGGIVVLLSVISYQRNKVWKDEWSIWNDAARKFPYKARAYNNRGKAYHDRGQTSEAMADFNKAIKLSPYYVYPYNNRGNLFFDQHHFALALADYDKVVALQADYAPVYNNRGNIYRVLGQFPKALADYNKAIDLDPQNDTAYNNRGIIYEKEGLLTEAMQDFNKAIEINDANKEAYSNRGVLYGKQGKFNQAVLDFDKAVTIDPGFSEGYDNRGFAYLNEGRLDEALADFNKALQIDPQNIKAFNNRAMVYYRQKNL